MYWQDEQMQPSQALAPFMSGASGMQQQRQQPSMALAAPSQMPVSSTPPPQMPSSEEKPQTQQQAPQQNQPASQVQPSKVERVLSAVGSQAGQSNEQKPNVLGTALRVIGAIYGIGV